MSTLLVTGGAGYVGSHTAQHLIEGGHRVVVLDSLETGHRAAVPPGAAFVQADLRDAAALERVFAEHRFSAILHFASYIVVAESVAEPLKYLGDNLAAAANLVRAAARHGVGKFVLSSTAAVYAGGGEAPLAETATIDPANPYGESKRMIERMLHWAEGAHGIRHAVLRYFNAAGAHPLGHMGEHHDPETHLIPIALQVALGQRRELTIYGTDYPTPDGTCLRDYIHVMDLAAAHAAVLPALETRSMTYNLGTGRGHSVRQVAEMAAEVTGRAIPVRLAPRRPGDSPMLVADPSAIEDDLGWSAERAELRTIIADAWRWHETHPAGYPD